MGFVTAASANANNSIYTYQQKSLQNGTHFYRLKMVDNDGTFQYSPIKSVTVDMQRVVNIFPNPARDFINVQVKSVDPDMKIRLLDASGKVIKQVTVTTFETNITLGNVAKGIYYIELYRGNEILSSSTFVIQ